MAAPNCESVKTLLAWLESSAVRMTRAERTCLGCGVVLDSFETVQAHLIMCHPPGVIEIYLGLKTTAMALWVGRSIETMARGAARIGHAT